MLFLHFILTDMLLFLEFFKFFVAVSSDISYRNFRFFRPFFYDLYQLFPALLGKDGDIDSDYFSIVHRRKSQIGFHDSLFYFRYQPIVPGLDGNLPAFRYAQACELLHRGRCSIIVNDDSVEKTHRGPAGPDAAEFLLERVYSAL